MIDACPRTVTPSLYRPDERRGEKHSVQIVYGRTVGQEYPNRFAGPRHCGAVQRRDLILVLGIRIEATIEHGFKDSDFSALGCSVSQKMMLETQLVAQFGLRRQPVTGIHFVPAGTG